MWLDRLPVFICRSSPALSEEILSLIEFDVALKQSLNYGPQKAFCKQVSVEANQDSAPLAYLMCLNNGS